jgi:hypothetical protein
VAELLSTDPSVRFAEIENFPGYAIGDDGSVFSLWRHSGEMGTVWNPIYGGFDKDNYCVVSLRRAGKSYTRRVHILVADDFIVKRPPGMEV